MVLNGLGFTSRALYLMPQYLSNKPVDLLIAPGLTAADFNDDTLGRSLDQLFEAGVTEVFAQAARQALKTYGIRHRFYHLDSSSFHVHGQYTTEEPQPHAIEITYGHSKDHRPDLKQVVVNLITGQRSQIPVWMEALSGNSSDKKRFPDSIRAFCEQMEGEDERFFVVDSALYSVENLKTLGDVRWLTRVPENVAAARQLIATPQAETLTELSDGYACLEVPSDYGGVAQRWLLIYSPPAAKREEKTLQRRVEKEKQAAERAWRKLRHQTFNCPEDALAALDECQKNWKYHRLEATTVPLTRYAHPGRPARGMSPDVIGCHLTGEIVQVETALAQARRKLGRFVLATNETDVEKWPPGAMLSQYKAQAVSVERGFRFLKDPLFFADSLFLKNPGRIMALTMVMVLALLIYALAERKLRLRLAESGQSVPNQAGKDTQTPTMRWVFQMFEGIDLLLIYQDEQVVQRQVLNLKQIHLDVLRLLGPPVLNCYLLSP
jgi:transposase